jgi:acetyl esterase
LGSALIGLGFANRCTSPCQNSGFFLRDGGKPALLLLVESEIKTYFADAMKLDPRVAEWMQRLARPGEADWRAPIEDVRRRFWQFAHGLEKDAPALHEIRNLKIPGAESELPARLYTPHAAGVSGPGLIFFHGGGFITGDLDSHDMLCRRLANDAHLRIISVAYRLAPEHKFPCAVDDCLAATRWVFENAPSLGMVADKLAVGGDSAGGNLAAVTAQQLRKHAPALKAQVLIYPSTQWVQMTPSQIRLREGYMLTQAAQDFFKSRYLRTAEDELDVRASPLLENDLFGLPPAYVVTGAYDPLRDEGKAYADKLAACGVDVKYREYADQPHGFFSMTAISGAAKKAIEETGAWLAEKLA